MDGQIGQWPSTGLQALHQRPKSMSTNYPKADKDTDSEQHSQWQQAGVHQLRRDSKNVSDGLNGTIFLNVGDVEAIGVEAGDEIRVRADANGKQTTATRKIHNNGTSITLPAERRRELDLDESDEVAIKIAPVADRRDEPPEDRTQLEFYGDSKGPEETETKELSRSSQWIMPSLIILMKWETCAQRSLC